MMKKINKHHIFILVGVLALLVVGIITLVLLGKTEIFNFKYGVSSPAWDSNITIDKNTAIDGKRDEKFWNDNTLVFTEVKSGIEVTSWAHIGENGLYLFTETDDPSVYWSSEKQFFENDSVEYYIDPRPGYSMQIDALEADVKVRTDNVQVRVDTMGRISTWFGRKTESGYPWVAGDFEALTAAEVDGKMNKKNGASGYGVETFIPWDAMGLESKPEEVGVMPAFNNVDNREDTSRTWFTVKGMNHAAPTSYAKVDKDGFVQIDEGITLEKELTADWNDKAYDDKVITLTEVNEANQNLETRGELKAFLGKEGVYFLVSVKDKVLAKGSDSIWNNDGIEIVIDSEAKGGDNCFREGTFRLAVDIDEGIETDICIDGYGDYIASRRAAFCKTNVEKYTGDSTYDYKNTLVYEVMVPYSSMGLTKKPSQLSFAWAVKSPNETTYIFNRRNGAGEMEGQDWLWTNRHYPLNPNEYYLLTSKGLVGDFEFPEWTAWNKCKIRSQAQTRYDYRGFADKNGLYINMVQYVDKIAYGGVGGSWKDLTHIEMQLWNGDVGYGWDGTYLAFFPDGSNYINSMVNVDNLQYRVTVTDRGAGYAKGYRYELSYEIYLGFENNPNSEDGPYAYVQMMSHTPGESNKGYENSIKVVKDGDRELWADNCNSYEFRKEGIVAMDYDEPYTFPAWTSWENCEIRSLAQTRYDYRGRAVDDGLYINMMQYVDEIKHGGANGTWKDITHIEMELWNGDVGYGWDGTYLAFFPDGSNYINSMNNVTAFESECTITDRGANYKDGYRYMLSYEIYIGFPNNVGSQDGPYAFVQMMSCTPGEGTEGYENSIVIVKDGDRELWADDCNSYEFRSAGIVARDGGQQPESDYEFQEWTAWEDCRIRSLAKTRYDYRGFAADDGLYLNMVQYVDNVASGGVSGTWKDITHVEMELWNGDVGYGWDGTYLAFFPDGSHYINSDLNVTALEYKCTITDRGANYADGYRYELSYEIYLGFENNVESEDGPYAFVQMMSHTPGETTEGYEKSITVVKDGDRNLWADNCNSYEFREEGIVARDGGEYVFPEWTAWENCGVRSQAQSRYDYRGFAADDGLYINMVQYVDNYVSGGVAGTWKDITHVEMELWNGDVGYGWDGTYLAFFPDGTHYINNDTNVTALQHKCTITDRGEDYADGYRYMLSYEIYLGFANNVASQDGPYAYVQMMSYTPGETTEGYENSITIVKDGNRNLWADNCSSYEFREAGIVSMDVSSVNYDSEIQDRKAQWEQNGNDGKTTLFIGDSFFDTDFWSNFYTMSYSDKDALALGISTTTSYDWETWASGWLKETNPKNIVMHVGTNNVYDDGDSVEEAVTGLKNMFTAIHENLPNTPIYWFGISQRSYDNDKIAKVTEINAQMKEWCEAQDYMTYIDTPSKLTNDMLRDNVHPKLEYYKVFVDALAETDIVMEKASLGFDFPEIADFSTISSDYQSADPNLYNFQMWAKEDGLYAYFVQKLPSVTLDNSDNWKNTHVEMEIWNEFVGYGWGGTYIGLFADGTYYINNQTGVKNVSYKVKVDSSDSNTTVIEYYFHLEFDNDPTIPYADVKQYQCIPGVDTSGLNSQTVTRDDRQLVTGTETAYMVEDTIIDKY